MVYDPDKALYIPDPYDYKKTILPSLAGMISGGALAAMRGRSVPNALTYAALGGLGGGANAFGDNLTRQGEYNKQLADMINQSMWKQKENALDERKYQTDLPGKRAKQLLDEKKLEDYGKGSNLPGLGMKNYYEWYRGLPSTGTRPGEPSQQDFGDFLAKTGYNRMLGVGEDGEPIYTSTRGTLGKVTPTKTADNTAGMADYTGEIQPTIKPTLAAGETTKLSKKASVLDEIQTLRNLYNTPDPGTGNPQGKNWVGWVDGVKGLYGEKVSGALPEQQAKFYALLSDLQNMELYTKSGAQINEQEFQRILSSLPSRYLPDGTFQARLDRWVDTTSKYLEDNIGGLEKAGYRNMDKFSGGKTNGDPLDNILFGD
jgi:hypothetical protein